MAEISIAEARAILRSKADGLSDADIARIRDRYAEFARVFLTISAQRRARLRAEREPRPADGRVAR